MWKSGRMASEHSYPTSTSTLEDCPTPHLPHRHPPPHPASTTQGHRGVLGVFLTACVGKAEPAGWTQPSSQGSQPPVVTVWTFFRMTILHIGSSPYSRLQRWTPPLHTAAPTVASSPPTEPAGPTTRPPPANFTPHHLASRRPSDPQHRPRQTCYRALPSTATRDCQNTHTANHTKAEIQNY